MELQRMVAELERLCPGCSFETGIVDYIFITEFSRDWVVDLKKLGLTTEEWFELEIDRHSSQPPEKYRIICSACGLVVLGYGNYAEQMRRADELWYCPRCGRRARFDDENYNSHSGNQAKHN